MRFIVIVVILTGVSMITKTKDKKSKTTMKMAEAKAASDLTSCREVGAPHGLNTEHEIMNQEVLYPWTKLRQYWIVL